MGGSHVRQQWEATTWKILFGRGKVDISFAAAVVAVLLVCHHLLCAKLAKLLKLARLPPAPPRLCFILGCLFLLGFNQKGARRMGEMTAAIDANGLCVAMSCPTVGIMCQGCW